MLARTVQLLLAFVLCWVGLSAPVQAASPANIAGGQVEAQLTGDLPQCELPGSDAAHHPDDRPAQTQAESGMDLPALLQRLADLRVAPAPVRPAPHRMAAWLTPTLDGLRRPPRGPSATA